MSASMRSKRALASYSREDQAETTPKGRSNGNGRGQAAQAFSRFELLPKSLEAMHQTLAKRDIRLTPNEHKCADNFFAQMQASQWTTGRGQPVRDWVATLLGRLRKIKTGFKAKAADWREREGKMPLRKMRIAGLQRIRQDLQDEANALFRADRDATRGQRSILHEKMEAIDAELERKTGRSREVLKMERCAARGEQESAERRHTAKAHRSKAAHENV
jgi:hypothetical protein